MKTMDINCILAKQFVDSKQASTHTGYTNVFCVMYECTVLTNDKLVGALGSYIIIPLVLSGYGCKWKWFRRCMTKKQIIICTQGMALS